MSSKSINNCQSCNGLQVVTPAAAKNSPGSSNISFRIGTYVDFKMSMIARLSSNKNGAMAGLTSRDEDDFTLALIDSWSVTCDLISFYSELWMKESFLNTSAELMSTHELSSLTGYAPHPGAAANVDLQFLMAEEEGAPREAIIEIGTKAQSTPKQDEVPVIFETVEEIIARPAWNGMRPKLTKPHQLNNDSKVLYFSGATTGLKNGDAIYFKADNGDDVFAMVRDVEIQVANVAQDVDSIDLTLVRIQPLSSLPLHSTAVTDLDIPLENFELPTNNYIGQQIDSSELQEVLAQENITEEDFFSPLLGSIDSPKQVLVFRNKASIFGHNAPPLNALPSTMTGPVPIYGTDSDDNLIIDELVDGPYAKISNSNWAEGNLTIMDDGSNNIHLDRTVDDINNNSYVILRDGHNWAVYRVNDTTEESISYFTVTGKSSQITLDSDNNFSSFSIRSTTAYTSSELLTLAQIPLTGYFDSTSSEIELNQWSPGLEAGKKVIITGTTLGSKESSFSIVAEIAKVIHDFSPGKGSRLELTSTLGYEFSLLNLFINANVASATQGESVFEILGSIQPSTPFQKFRVQQAPQTHVSAATASGVEPTLEVRVDKLKWERVDSFINVGPQERVYTTSIDEAGITTVAFGDGINGARPPVGRDNVRVNYRKNHGLEGRVDAEQLNILMSQPLGVKEVLNPLAADGGADPESIYAIKNNAPLICRTLERVVSLTDYQDFARGYAGIEKSLAQWIHVKNFNRVVLTIAGEQGTVIAEDGSVYEGLTDAIALAADPYEKFFIKSHIAKYFKVAVKLKVHDDYLFEDVANKTEVLLRETFSFSSRNFGQPVFISEVIQIIQDVEGVEAVIVERLYKGTAPARSEALAANLAQVQTNGTIVGAELLTLHPGPLDYIEVMS